MCVADGPPVLVAPRAAKADLPAADLARLAAWASQRAVLHLLKRGSPESWPERHRSQWPLAYAPVERRSRQDSLHLHGAFVYENFLGAMYVAASLLEPSSAWQE